METLFSRKKKLSEPNPTLIKQAQFENISLGSGKEHLVEDEVAFLSREVREALVAAELPQLPCQYEDQGAVLFVDISGFTNLGNQLRKDFTAASATEYLSKEIFGALKTLCDICLAWGGDIAKFAGDALLCVWKVQTKEDINEHEHPELYYEIPTLEFAQQLARRAGYEMMKAIKTVANGTLELHGGLGAGKLLQFHLGNDKAGVDSNRWHLVTGEACVQAGELLDDSPKGSIYYVTDERDESGQLVMHEITRETDITLDESLFVQEMKEVAVQLDVREWTERMTKKRVMTYIPKALREDLQSGVIAGGEIYPRVSIMFVGLDHLQLTKDELEGNVVAQDKLRRLNDVYSTMVQIVHSFGGEVRDLLFDDKGCVFIAVFGAHVVVELSELKCVRAALRLVNGIRQAKIGIDVGQCFTGLCGSEQRHDFVVMGHEVNMASRFMGGAKVGQILAGPGIQKKAKSFIKFTPFVLEYYKRKPVQLEDGSYETRKVKTDDFDCFITEKPINRNPSFIANFRSKGSFTSVNMAEKTFVGRQAELAQIGGFISMMTKHNKSATIMITGEEGIGKSALVQEVRNQQNLKSEIIFAASFSIEQNTAYYVARQLICSMLEIDEDDGSDKILDAFKKIQVKTDFKSLSAIFPETIVDQRESIRILARSPESFNMRKAVDFASPIKPKEHNRIVTLMTQVVINYQELVIKDEDQSLLLIIEDLQWCDKHTLELIIGLIKAELPRVVVIMSSRDLAGITDTNRRETLQNFFKKLDDSTIRNVARINLTYLNRKDSDTLVTNLFLDHDKAGRGEGEEATGMENKKQAKMLGMNYDDLVDTKIKELVFKKTRGQPNHLTLLVKWFIESKNVVFKQREYQYMFRTAMSEQQSEQSIPDTLKETIVYRLDFLPGDDRAILKVAATIGPIFPEDMLFEVLALDGYKITPIELQQRLESLETKGYLIHQGLKNELMTSKTFAIDPRLGAHMLRNKKDSTWLFSADITQQAIRSLIPNQRYEELWEYIEKVINRRGKGRGGRTRKTVLKRGGKTIKGKNGNKPGSRAPARPGGTKPRDLRNTNASKSSKG